MLKDVLVPVGAGHRAENIGEQITKVATELCEVREAYSKYDIKQYWHEQDQGELKKMHKDIAIEVGDVMIACVTLMDMLGYNLEEILEEVYKKNDERHYYE